MANDYVPDLTDLAPGEVARSSDVNTRYTNVVTGFDKLPAPKVGEKGFSEPCPVGEPVNSDHAVTKNWAETGMTSQLNQATTQATNALNSANQSATQATNSLNSANNSQTFASAASTSANNASISEGNAAASESAASTSEANAAASEAAAAISETNAGVSETNAAASETAALAAQAAAELAYDQFDDRYLGAKTSNPVADNDNNTLVAGALYFNSTAGEMRVWSGTEWLAAYLPPTTLLVPGDNVSELTNDAGYLTGNQTVTLTGDASGSGTTSINVTVANDSHTHDGRYYTEGEIQSILSGSTGVSGYNNTDWDTAYGDKINSASFNSANGVLTLTRQDTGTVTVDLDGRYLTSQTTYSAGSGLNLTGTTFSHSNTSSANSSNNSGQTFIQDITLDTYGHITAIGTGTATNTTYTSGSGIQLAGTVFSHADTSTANSLSASGNNFIKGITLDEFGHITGLTQGTAADTNTTYSAGSGISLSGTTFSVAGGTGLTQTASGLSLSSDQRLGGGISTYHGGADSYVRIQDGATAYHRWYLNGVEEMRLTSTGQLDVDQNIVAYSATITSDRRFKKDDAPLENCLDKVLALQAKSYTWNERSRREGVRDVGLIAQEVQSVIPEIVEEVPTFKGEENETHLTVDYAKLSVYLLEAIKELKAEIEELKRDK